MKSRTSFFNGTVLLKDITRYAPVWALYTIMLALYLLLVPGQITAVDFARVLPDIMDGMSLLNVLYAGLCAFMLFGDLFNPRLCNALHALPMRREGWFLTHTAAGILFCIVPNLFAAVLASLFLQQYSYLAFLWLAVMVLQFIFFFGVGAISAVCAGNRLGMLAIYSIINLLSYILAVFVHSFVLPSLVGVQLDLEPFTHWSPVFKLFGWGYVEMDYDYMMDALFFEKLNSEVWTYTGICAGVGLLFMSLAVLVYRKRKLESAGDFIALRPLSPVFMVIYTLGVGVVLYEYVITLMGFSRNLGYAFLAVGITIGFFTGRMLLERKVNVFKAKNFLGLGIFAVVLAASMALFWMDPFGIARYVPEVEDIAQVEVYDRYNYYYGYKEERTYALKDPADLKVITGVHKRLADQRSQEGGEYVRLIYTLKNGKKVERYYPIKRTSVEAQTLIKYFSSWQYTMGTDDWDWVLENTRTVIAQLYAGDRGLVLTREAELYESDKYNAVIYIDENTEHYLVQLMEAIRKDCDAGTMARWCNNGEISAYGWLDIQMGNLYPNFDLSKENVHTIEAIEALAEIAEAAQLSDTVHVRRRSVV